VIMCLILNHNVSLILTLSHCRSLYVILLPASVGLAIACCLFLFVIHRIFAMNYKRGNDAKNIITH